MNQGMRTGMKLNSRLSYVTVKGDEKITHPKFDHGKDDDRHDDDDDWNVIIERERKKNVN